MAHFGNGDHKTQLYCLRFRTNLTELSKLAAVEVEIKQQLVLISPY